MSVVNKLQSSFKVFRTLALSATVALVGVCVLGCRQAPSATKPKNVETASDVRASVQSERATTLYLGGNLGAGASGVQYAPFTDDDVAKIRATSGPIVLNVKYSEIADGDLERIADNPQITQISFVDAPNLTDAAVEILASCPNLKTIWFVEVPQLKSPNFGALAQTKIVEAHLRNCVNLSPESIAGLADCDGLEVLEIACCPVSDAALAQLTKSTSLTGLVLTACPGLADSGIAELAKLPELKSLLLRENPQITELGLAKLSKAAKLQRLALGANPKVTEENVNALQAKLPQTKIVFEP